MENICYSVCDALWLCTIHIQGFCCKQKQGDKKETLSRDMCQVNIYKRTKTILIQTNVIIFVKISEKSLFVRLLKCYCYCSILVRM